MITPNSFVITFTDDKAFIMSFADMKINENRVDVLSEITLTETGFKSILKRMIEVVAEYEEKTNINILEQILKEGVIHEQ